MSSVVPCFIALVLLTALIWGAMEWVYYRELHYLRECLQIQSVRLVTSWPNKEAWRLAAEKLAEQGEIVVPEIVPAAAGWREPLMLPAAIMTEPDEPLKVVNITAALEDGQQGKAWTGPGKEPPISRLNEAFAQPRPRRKGTARVRRMAN